MSTLKEQLTTALKQARDVADRVDAESREFTADERQQIEGWLTEAKSLKTQIQQADGDASLRSAIVSLGEGVDLATRAPAASLAVPGRGKTIGEQFVDAPQFREWLARVAPNGHIPESAKGLVSPPVQFKDLLTGASDTSAGAMVVNDAPGLVVPLGRRPLTVRDIITNGRTTSDTVEYVRITTETNNAAPVAEATATSGGSGVKPESALVFEKVTAPVKTIAHWIPATKRALSDAGQLRTIVDSFLRDGLEQELEDQIIGGSGAGENFTGLDNVTGVQSQAWDTDILTTTRKARTLVRTVGRATPTAFLLHPTDWQTIDLLQDNEARYFFGGPAQVGAPMLWGLPVIESEAVTQGEGYVGDFRKMVIWDREQATITISDSHSDFFIRNMVAILGELRAAFGVLQPSAFVEMDLTA